MIPLVITVPHTLRKGVFALPTALPSTGKEVWLLEKGYSFQETSKIPTESQTDSWTFWAFWTFQGTSKIPTELHTHAWTFWAPWTNKPSSLVDLVPKDDKESRTKSWTMTQCLFVTQNQVQLWFTPLALPFTFSIRTKFSCPGDSRDK